MKIGIVTPQDPKTGISIYSAILAVELQNLGKDVSIISPNNSIDKLPIKHEDINYISPNNYVPENYDITHFQLANSNLHEFQLHLLDDHHNKLKDMSNIITTVHDARNFDTFNLKCSKCYSFGLNLSNTPIMYPFDIVDKAFQRISKYLIFHNNFAMEEYKTRYHLNNNSLRCIPISAYRLEDTKDPNLVDSDSDDNRILVPGYISPFKGQDIILKAVSNIDDNFKLVFMGKIVDKSYEIYLDSIIKKEGIQDKVEFLGFVTDNEFINQIDRAKIVLIPRLISSWLKKTTMYRFRKFLGLDYLINHSTSAVLTMSLVSGKPIICSKNQGFSEYINSSRGIFCEDNVESWRSAIKFLLENPEKQREMSENSKIFANNTLNPTMIAKRHIKLYNQCL
jgi:glycosyltransferase involved in cell wall biosynthesis